MTHRPHMHPDNAAALDALIAELDPTSMDAIELGTFASRWTS